MESLLTVLFDCQKFEENKDLQQVINAVHARHSRQMLDFEDDLEHVAAASMKYVPHQHTPLKD